MPPRQRTSLLIISVLVLLFILAAGLSNLELKPGRIFDIQNGGTDSGATPFSSNIDVWVAILRGIFVLVIILLPFYLIYMLIDPQRRKRLLAEIIGYAFFVGAILLLQSYFASLKQTDEILISTPTVEADFSQAGAPSGEAAVFNAEPSDLAVSLTGIAIAVLLAGSAGLAWWLFVHKKAPAPYILVKVAAEAEETLDSLLSGKDLRETILLCYRRMTEVAVKNRGIPREASITPHEFEQILVEKGMPAAAVHDLTHLFEDVRYGDLRADEAERRRAMLALRTVIAACRQTGEPAA